MSGPRQLHLFRPSLNPVPRLKSAMRQTLKECRYSREQVVDRLNELASREGLRTGRSDKISVALLDAWVAESKTGHVIPLELLPAFCLATESLAALEVVAASCGAGVIDERDSKILESAKLDLELKRLSRRKRKLERELEEDGHGH